MHEYTFSDQRCIHVYGMLRSIACDTFQTRAYDVIMCNDTSYSYDLFRIRVRCENMLMTRFEHARIM